MDSSVYFMFAIVLFVLAIGVFAVAAVLFMRSQQQGPQGPQGMPPQQPPVQRQPAPSSPSPASPPAGASGGVQMQAPPPAPDLPPGDESYEDEEMPTVIVSQPPQLTRPGGPADLGDSSKPTPGQRTAGATIIAFDDDDDD